MDNQELYLTELMALCVRKGKALLIAALVFALALGGFQLHKQIKASKDEQYSEEKIEERYQAAVEAYEKSIEDTKKAIADKEKAIEDKQEYLDNSILMTIDPYDKYVTDIYLAFSDIDEAAWDQVHYSSTSLDFVYSKIRSQYVVYWNSMKLPDDLPNSGYRDLEDKYIREVLSLSSQDGGMLLITAVGKTASASERLADSLYQAFVKLQPTVAQTAYGHNLTTFQKITKSTIDTGLESAQKSNQEAIENYRTDIEDLQKQLDEMEYPKREEGYSKAEIAKKTAQYVGIGAVVGLMAGAFAVLLWAVLANVLVSSYQMERQLKISCLGTVKAKKGLFDLWADKLCGERRWSSREQAVSFVVRKLETMTEPKARLLLATTRRKGKGTDGADALKDALTEHGYKVNCVYDATHDPAFMDAVKDNDGVVLFEKSGVTMLVSTADTLALIKSMEKPVQGFVLV